MANISPGRDWQSVGRDSGKRIHDAAVLFRHRAKRELGVMRRRRSRSLRSRVFFRRVRWGVEDSLLMTAIVLALFSVLLLILAILGHRYAPLGYAQTANSNSAVDSGIPPMNASSAFGQSGSSGSGGGSGTSGGSSSGNGAGAATAATPTPGLPTLLDLFGQKTVQVTPGAELPGPSQPLPGQNANPNVPSLSGGGPDTGLTPKPVAGGATATSNVPTPSPSVPSLMPTANPEQTGTGTPVPAATPAGPTGTPPSNTPGPADANATPVSGAQAPTVAAATPTAIPGSTAAGTPTPTAVPLQPTASSASVPGGTATPSPRLPTPTPAPVAPANTTLLLTLGVPDSILPIWSVNYATTPMKSTTQLSVTKSGNVETPTLQNQFGQTMAWVNLAPGAVVEYQGQAYLVTNAERGS